MAESGTENLVVDPCQYLKQELPVFTRGMAVELRKADHEQTVWLHRSRAGRSRSQEFWFSGFAQWSGSTRDPNRLFFDLVSPLGIFEVPSLAS